MTNIYEKINEDFQEIRNLVLIINWRFNTILFIKSDGAEEVTQNYEIFTHIYNSMYISIVLDLCKLFSKNEDYSFNKFLQKLERHSDEIEWNHKPDENLLKGLLSELKKELETPIIKKLKTARDKFYAHLDRNRPSDLQIFPEEIEILMYAAQGLVNRIYGPLFGQFQTFDFLYTEDSSKLLLDLYKYNQIKQCVAKETEDMTGSFEKISNIIKR